MSKVSDDGTIDLRNNNDEEPEFRIESIERDEPKVQSTVGNVEVAGVGELEETAMKAHDKVKLKFDKFVNLIATHAYEDILQKHREDDVIISTDLLTDLANAHEEKADKKMPLIFVFGIGLGIFVTWLILKV